MNRHDEIIINHTIDSSYYLNGGGSTFLWEFISKAIILFFGVGFDGNTIDLQKGFKWGMDKTENDTRRRGTYPKQKLC